MLTVLDLFSGIGGFSLGLERTGGFKTIAFCEIEPFPRKVLAKHWPGVPIFEDVRTLHARDIVGTVDVICGGFPCQDLSCAGKQAGFKGDRSSLYTEMVRLIGECRPQYAIFENVTALLSGDRGAWFAQFLYDLAAFGYDAEWHCIPASYAGAQTLRDRVWIVAHPQCESVQGRALVWEGWKIESREEQLARLVQPCSWTTIPSARDRGTGHGVPCGMERNKALGNSVVPQVVEMIGRAILEAENQKIGGCFEKKQRP